MSIRIAVDLGGTHLRAAVYRHNEKDPIAHKKTTSRSKDESIFERLLRLIEEVMPTDEEVTGIGVAVPGPVDPVNGIIIESPNIPEMNGFPLVARLTEKLNVPVFLGNDANLAALGEWRYGAGQGHDHLLYLTISTGVGVASFLHIFNPSIVILGGGVSQSHDLFWKPFDVSLRASVFNPAYLENLVVTTAALGDDAGLLGALALVETKENH